MRLTPGGLQAALDRYRARFFRGEGHDNDHKTSVFARYLIRLVTYGIVTVGVLALIRSVSRVIFQGSGMETYLFIIWVLATLACIPFFMLIGKYANHIVLLWVTRFPFVLSRIDVNRFYNGVLALLLAGMGAVYLTVSWEFVKGLAQSWEVVAIVVLAAVLFRRRLLGASELLERLLDEVFGLATSEPNRQAVMTGEKASFLDGIMEPVVLAAGSLPLNRSIRELGLREKAGASVVAIYRDGKHISNPSPDTRLTCNDILIIIGNDDERRKAREVLLGKGDGPR